MPRSGVQGATAVWWGGRKRRERSELGGEKLIREDLRTCLGMS